MFSPTSPAVGFIGLGDQGAPMARAIAEAGFDLHVWARRPESLAALDGLPFTAHHTPAGLGAISDIVGLCLNTDENVLDTLTTGGLLDAMKPGSVLVNHGTGLPAFARRMRELGAFRDVHVLDAPVSGGRAGAEAKQLTTIVGGDASTLDLTRPVFESFSTTIEHMGAAGSGQTAKLINNALLMANQQNLAEMLQIARALDVETGPLLELLRAGTGSSRALDSLGTAITTQNAAHLSEMQLVDMDFFAETIAELGSWTHTFLTRALDGAEALPELAARAS